MEEYPLFIMRRYRSTQSGSVLVACSYFPFLDPPRFSVFRKAVGPVFQEISDYKKFVV